MNSFREKVYNAVKRIPKGKVATYAAVAKVIGRPWAFRAVGNALHKNPFKTVPCHRVVCSDRSPGGYAAGKRVKLKILRAEGIAIKNGKVDSHLILISLHAKPRRNL